MLITENTHNYIDFKSIIVRIKTMELLTTCPRFVLKRPLCYLKLLNTIRVIFSIHRKKKLAMRKIDEEDFNTVLALVAITSDFIK